MKHPLKAKDLFYIGSEESVEMCRRGGNGIVPHDLFAYEQGLVSEKSS